MITRLCPACGNALSVYQPDAHLYAGCGPCGSLIDLSNPVAKVLHTFPPVHKSRRPRIALGDPVQWQGVTYTVAGWMYKRQKSEDFRWDEFVLWHPDHPNAVLVVLHDSALIVTPAEAQPSVYDAGYNSPVANYQGVLHQLENNYKFELLKAEGAFDWNPVYDAGRMVCQEYEVDEHFLISETLDGATRWYAGNYLERLELARAVPNGFVFESGRGFSEKREIEVGTRREVSLRFGLLATAVVALTQWILTTVRPERVVLDEALTIEHDSLGMPEAARPIRTASFTIDGPTGVTIVFSASLSNSWTEFSGVLVNETTGKEQEFSTTAESYHGYEGGESWSEGNASPEIAISSLQSGRYHLNIEAYTERGASVPATISVAQNSFWLSNFLLMLVVVLGYPLAYRGFTNTDE